MDSASKTADGKSRRHKGYDFCWEAVAALVAALLLLAVGAAVGFCIGRHIAGGV